MYEIFKKINETTFLALKDTEVYVLKKTGLEDVGLYGRLAEIDSRYVSKVYETTEIDGRIFAVCEYVQGVTLEKYLEKNGIPDDEDVRHFAANICEGLEQIHLCGIVHRDITPNNIMITSDGDAKIIDFGISRIVKESVSNDTQILGTQGYAAPEQYGFHQTNEKADIYAVGVLINYMKTGCLPSEKITNGVFTKIVKKCTEMDETKRYESAKELKNAINNKYRLSAKIKKLFYSVPGFSREKPLLTAFSILYYIFCLPVIIPLPENAGKHPILGNVIPMTFIFAISYFFLNDIGGWTEKFGINVKAHGRLRVCLTRIAAAVVCVVIGLVFVVIFSDGAQT